MTKPVAAQRLEKIREIEEAKTRRIGTRALRRQLMDLTVREIRGALRKKRTEA